jgi:cellulose synthase/poly-beta-1,6-N-acetylglucosamine synthase-like glycosyltransferase
VSAVVPATNRPPTLERCLDAIRHAVDGPDELVVVDEPRSAGPAEARNIGVDQTTGDIIVFVDADVEVKPDVFEGFRAAFEQDTELSAVFGSYDDDPGAPGTVSAFRNLLHHHVHQKSAGAAGTFWAGLGAIRRDAFLAVGGFADHPIEDIELGMRLSATGAAIRLHPGIQGKHLKRWTLTEMVRTDFAVRGVPWVELLLRQRQAPTNLNLGWRERMSAAACVAAVVCFFTRRHRLGAGALALFVAANVDFYRLLIRRRGAATGFAGVALHAIHQLTAVAALVVGISKFVLDRLGSKADAA